MTRETLRSIAEMVDPQPGIEAGEDPQASTNFGGLNPEDIDVEAVRECAGLDHSDSANGVRLRRHFGHDLAVLETEGDLSSDYVTWTGDHWDAASGNNAAHAIAQKIGDLIKLEADYLPPKRGETDSAYEARQARRRSFGVTSRNTGRIKAMLTCAAPYILKKSDDFNADPLIVATRTHTLTFAVENLERGEKYAEVKEVTGHRREDYITKIAPVDYKPDAKCPLWTAFLERFLPNNNVRDFVQMFSGVGLLGEPLQYILFHYGMGANGKSVFMETLTSVLGPLAIDLPSETLVGTSDRAGGGASPDLARLYGARTVRVSELTAGTPLREDLVKKLTGGERIPVRNLFKGFFDFRPVFKAHMSGNEYPFISGTDDGIWRRIGVIHWPVQIPEAERRSSKTVVAEFVAEAPGILNWLIDGALRYLEQGFVIPAEVKSATKEYRDEMDPVGQFLADCVERQDGSDVTARAMYDAYCAWSSANAKRALSETKFSKATVGKLEKELGRVRKYLNCALHDVPARPAPRYDDRDVSP